MRPTATWWLRDIRDFEREHLFVSCVAELHLFAAELAHLLAVRCHEHLFLAHGLQRRNLLEQRNGPDGLLSSAVDGHLQLDLLGLPRDRAHAALPRERGLQFSESPELQTPAPRARPPRSRTCSPPFLRRMR